MDEELDYGEDEGQQHPGEMGAAGTGADEPFGLYDGLEGALGAGSGGTGESQPFLNGSGGGVPAAEAVHRPQAQPARSATPSVTNLSTEVMAEEWQVMYVPEDWRPRPMVRIWGLPAAAAEGELSELLSAQDLELGVRSVTFDPKQTTQAGKVALIRFDPPPQPGDSQAAEPDVGKVADRLIAALRAKQLELHGAKINVEKTGAEVCLFLANLGTDMETDDALRAACERYGTIERCFIMRNPSGESKHYAFCEFTLPAAAAACKEAWNKAGEAQRAQLQREGAGHNKVAKVKLQRAEVAPIKSVAGLFATSLYVDNMSPTFTNYDTLKRIFSEYGEVLSCYMPRSPTIPSQCRGFAFVHFKHSNAADAAFRALDGTEHAGIGKLVISFSNPIKAGEQQLRNASGAATSAGSKQQQQQQQPYVGSSAPGARSFAQSGAPTRTAVGASTLANQRGVQSLPKPPPPPMGATLMPMAAGAVTGMPGGARIILPGAGVGGPTPAPPNPMLLQQQQQAAAMQAQMAVQQRLAMQQMMMMQQQPWLAMQQAAMQQQAAAMAEELRAKQAALEAAKEEERRRKEEEEKKKAEEQARLEAEYAARLGYGMASFGGLNPSAALAGLAANPMAAMAAAAGLPGFGTAFGGLGAAGGLGAGLGDALGGGSGAVTGTKAGSEPPAGAGTGRGRSSAAAGYEGSFAAGFDEDPEPRGGRYDRGGYDSYAGREEEPYGGRGRSGDGGYGGSSSYGGRVGADEYGGRGEGYDGRGGGDYDYRGDDDAYGMYEGGARYGSRGGGRGSPHDRHRGGAGGGRRGGHRGGGGGKRDPGYTGGGGYGDGYGYGPKRPRY